MSSAPRVSPAGGGVTLLDKAGWHFGPKAEKLSLGTQAGGLTFRLKEAWTRARCGQRHLVGEEDAEAAGEADRFGEAEDDDPEAFSNHIKNAKSSLTIIRIKKKRNKKNYIKIKLRNKNINK